VKGTLTWRRRHLGTDYPVAEYDKTTQGSGADHASDESQHIIDTLEALRHFCQQHCHYKHSRCNDTQSCGYGPRYIQGKVSCHAYPPEFYVCSLMMCKHAVSKYQCIYQGFRYSDCIVPAECHECIICVHAVRCTRACRGGGLMRSARMRINVRDTAHCHQCLCCLVLQYPTFMLGKFSLEASLGASQQHPPPWRFLHARQCFSEHTQNTCLRLLTTMCCNRFHESTNTHTLRALICKQGSGEGLVVDLSKQSITDAHIERLAERAKRTTSVTDWIVADNPLVRMCACIQQE
jgi:hypothetical protein